MVTTGRARLEVLRLVGALRRLLEHLFFDVARLLDDDAVLERVEFERVEFGVRVGEDGVDLDRLALLEELVDQAAALMPSASQSALMVTGEVTSAGPFALDRGLGRRCALLWPAESAVAVVFPCSSATPRRGPLLKPFSPGMPRPDALQRPRATARCALFLFRRRLPSGMSG